MENGMTELTMPTICWKILTSCLGLGGWANSHRDIYTVGKLEEDKVINLQPEPPPNSAEVVKKEWMEKVEVIILSERQFEVSKKSVTTAIKNGSLIPSKYAMTLLVALKIEDSQ